MATREKILNFLTSGKTLTTAQARFQYRIKNVSARIHELRKTGHNIVTEKKTLASGKTVNVYRLEQTPSRTKSRKK